MTLRTSAPFRSRARLNVLALAASALLFTAAAADEIVMTCPAEGLLPEVTLRYVNDALLVTSDTAQDATLTATMKMDPAGTGMFAIEGWGAMILAMPDPEELDACIAARLERQNATAEEADAVTYVINLCWREVPPAPTPQEVDAEMQVFPGETIRGPELYVTLRYRTPSAVTGKPLQLNDFVFRKCDLLSSP